MAKKMFPLSDVYRLLEPGPVVMVTTARKGEANIMISGRNYSFEALVATKECVLNIPSVEMAKQVVGVGNCSGSKVDKFRKFKLTAMSATKVAAPLIAECFANLECKVVDTRMVNKYNFFVLEVVKAWIDPAQKNPRTLHHQGKGIFAVDGDRIKLPSKMA
jgi:flavin reductase (DIM6/NTAB) family NADH-FMN oxidoreductase RutF